ARRLTRFGETIFGDVDPKPLRDDAAGFRIFETIENRAEDAEARRHDAARVAGMHALRQHFNGEVADDRAAQRSRDPELFVIAAAAVETDDESRRADAIGVVVDVRRQIDGSAFFAAFNDDDDARVFESLLLHGFDRADRG